MQIQSDELLILDRDLPHGGGLDLLRHLRMNRQNLPCLGLTARNALHDRIDGLESGAGDYLVKPFAMDELVARVPALLRRPGQLQLNDPHSMTQRLNTHKLPQEVLPLINTFNQTLDRLEKAFKVQQAFLATTAHELKTPLALLRGEIEMAEHFPKRELLLKDIDQVARLIHQLLHWAEARESQNYQYQPLYLTDVAEEVALYLNRLSVTCKVQIVIMEKSQASLLHADRSTCFVLLKNLLKKCHSPRASPFCD